LVDLGVTQDLQSALRKLAAALPATRLSEASLSLERIHLDWTSWERLPDPAPHLGAIQQAVWKGNCLGITYRSPLFGDWIEPLQAMIEPYGLVAKAGHWYLVCTANGHFQVIPVDNIHCIDQVGASFTRLTGFDLAVFWREWCASQRKNQPQYLVRLRVASAAMPILKRRFAHMDVIKQLEGENPEGRQEFNVLFESLEEARSYLLGYGQAVEVLEPEALRLSLADFARQIVNLYLCYNFPHSRSTC
jgi:predicted DNA-binding transcriptional regulator YafY